MLIAECDPLFPFQGDQGERGPVGQPGPQGRQVSARQLGWVVRSMSGHLICFTTLVSFLLRAQRGSRGPQEFQGHKACQASRETRYQMGLENIWEEALRPWGVGLRFSPSFQIFQKNYSGRILGGRGA